MYLREKTFSVKCFKLKKKTVFFQVDGHYVMKLIKKIISKIKLKLNVQIKVNVLLQFMLSKIFNFYVPSGC